MFETPSITFTGKAIVLAQNFDNFSGNNKKKTGEHQKQMLFILLKRGKPCYLSERLKTKL